MKVIVILTFYLVSAQAIAQAQAWTQIARGTDATFYFKKDSYNGGTYRHDRITMVTYKLVDSKDNSVTAGTLFIKNKDCDQKQGKLFTADLEGNVRFDNDFIFGLGNLTSRMAEELCKVYFVNR